MIEAVGVHKLGKCITIEFNEDVKGKIFNVLRMREQRDNEGKLLYNYLIITIKDKPKEEENGGSY